MRAIQYTKSVPRWLLMRFIGPHLPTLYTSGWSPVRLADISEPPLPGDDWVRVKPRLSGICGSDIATITCQGSPYFSALTSTPFTLGHETVGTVAAGGARGIAEGQRVVLQPALGCEVRGISPVCPSCARGDVALCLNVTEGRISAGIQTGFCHDTGGTWADSFVAHVSQLYTVPDNVSDESAVLVEPFACALHGAIRANIQPEETVFIIGCGSIGLLSIAALRALGFGGLIVAAARHPHQGDHARRLGATAVIGAPRGTKRRYKEWAEITGARVRKAELGKPAVLGGADAVFDCVGSSTSIDDAIRFSRPGGRVVLVGMPGVPKGVDWTPMWYQETRVIPTYAYGTETLGNRRMATFALALKMLEDGWDERLKPLADPPVALAEWPRAFDNATHVRENKTVKSVLRIGA